MKNYTVKNNQNIYDLAIQLYGDNSYFIKLLTDNNITDINQNLTNMTLVYDETIYLQNVYTRNNINIATHDYFTDNVDIIDAGFDAVLNYNETSLINPIIIDAGLDDIINNGAVTFDYEFISAGIDSNI